MIVSIIIINSAISFENEHINRVRLFYEVCDMQEYNVDCKMVPRMAPLGSYAQSQNQSMVVALEFALPLVIILTVGLYFGSRIHSYLKNEIMRKDYNAAIKSHVLMSYLKTIVAPLSGIIILIVFSFVSYNGRPSGSLYYTDPDIFGIPFNYYNITWFYYLIFVINLILLGIYIANIYIIVSRYIRNIVTSIITSYVVYNIFNIFVTNFVGYGVAYYLYYISKNENAAEVYNYFDYNMVFHIEDLKHPIILTVNLFVIVLLTTIMIIKIYKNKEKVIMASEK